MSNSIDVIRFFKDSYQKGYPIIFPTGMGSEVCQTVELTEPLGTTGALLTDHGRLAVRKTHEAHVANETDVTTTATWKRRIAFKDACSEACGNWAERSEHVFTDGVRLARNVVDDAEQTTGHVTLVGLSIGPLECSNEPKFVHEAQFTKHIHFRTAHVGAYAGADFNAFETFSTVKETVEAAKAGSEVYVHTNVPFTVSLKPGKNGGFLDGPISDAIEQIRDLHGLAALGLNCILPSQVPAALYEVKTAYKGPIIVYANGDEHHQDDRVHHAKESKEYASLAQGWLNSGATGVGGCCGTTSNPYGSDLTEMVKAVRAERRFNKPQLRRDQLVLI